MHAHACFKKCKKIWSCLTHLQLYSKQHVHQHGVCPPQVLLLLFSFPPFLSSPPTAPPPTAWFESYDSKRWESTFSRFFSSCYPYISFVLFLWMLGFRARGAWWQSWTLVAGDDLMSLTSLQHKLHPLSAHLHDRPEVWGFILNKFDETETLCVSLVLCLGRLYVITLCYSDHVIV